MIEILVPLPEDIAEIDVTMPLTGFRIRVIPPYGYPDELNGWRIFFGDKRFYGNGARVSDIEVSMPAVDVKFGDKLTTIVSA